VVLDLVARPAASTDWIAEVHFLAPDAPRELLKEGAQFELFEGRKCVGIGSVLAPAADPQTPSDVALPAQ